MNVLENKVRDCLSRAGMMSLPGSEDEDLIIYGFDSLIKALSVIEIEREFQLRISTTDLDKNNLSTLKDFYRLVSDKKETQTEGK